MADGKGRSAPGIYKGSHSYDVMLRVYAAPGVWVERVANDIDLTLEQTHNVIRRLAKRGMIANDKRFGLRLTIDGATALERAVRGW